MHHALLQKLLSGETSKNVNGTENVLKQTTNWALSFSFWHDDDESHYFGEYEPTSTEDWSTDINTSADVS